MTSIIENKFSIKAQETLLEKERKSNDFWHKFVRNKSALVGLIIVIITMLLGILAPVIAPYDPNKLDLANPYAKPFSEGHIFGTDDLGRDLLSRIVYGARMSVIVAIGSTILGGVIGICLGLLSGYMGGTLDSVLMRFMDGMFAFPFVLLSILLVTILGSGPFNVILAIAIGNAPRFARLVRSKVIVAKNEEYIHAVRVLGASHLRTMFSHILPNTTSEVIVYATLMMGSAIIMEASLSFIGLGILIPTPSWGNILQGGRNSMATAPHIAIISGLLIFITVIGYNLFGDGIRDVMDPKMKR